MTLYVKTVLFKQSESTFQHTAHSTQSMPEGKAVDMTKLGASPHTLKCPPVKINLSII